MLDLVFQALLLIAGVAAAWADSPMAALFLVAAIGLAWLAGVLGLSIAYTVGTMSKLDEVEVPITSIWYLVNLLSLALLTLAWVADRWFGALGDAESARGTSEREEARYRSLFEQSPDGILVSGRGFEILDANPAFCALLGYTVEELRAMPYESLLEAPDRARYLAVRDGLRLMAHPWIAERRMVAKDGSIRVVELSTGQLPDGNGLITFRDLTARVAAETEVRRMAAAIEAAEDLVRIDDASGVIQYVNPGFERATGYTAAEALGRTGASLLRSGIQDPAFYAELDEAIAQGRPWQGRVDSRRKDGTLFPMPVTLPVDETALPKWGEAIVLNDARNNPLAIMEIEEVFHYDPQREPRLVFGTVDPKHPMVSEMVRWGKVYVTGTLRVMNLPIYHDFVDLRRTPAEVRALLEKMGNTNVVAFQTRNPMHRIHEELTKRAAEEVGGSLLIHPVVGMTRIKSGAIVRMSEFGPEFEFRILARAPSPTAQPAAPGLTPAAAPAISAPTNLPKSPRQR